MAKIDLLLALIEGGIIDSDLKNCTGHTFPHVNVNISTDALCLAWAKDPDFIKKYPEAMSILVTNPISKFDDEDTPARKQAKQPLNDLELR